MVGCEVMRLASAVMLLLLATAVPAFPQEAQPPATPPAPQPAEAVTTTLGDFLVKAATQMKLPASILVDASLHRKSPGRFRECLQTVRSAGLGLVVTDLSLLGPLDYWTIVAEEFPEP